jgi:RHS repeat-associated protein
VNVSGTLTTVWVQAKTLEPAGMPPAVPNKKLYNGGSEWQNDYSNNQPDYYQTLYRNYDAALGRWASIDPQADSVRHLTPYLYANNNPIMFNDPLGNLSQAQWDEVLDIYFSGPITASREYIDGISGYFTLDNQGNRMDYVAGQGIGGRGSNWTVNSIGQIRQANNIPVVPEEGKEILWAIGNSSWQLNDKFLVVNSSDVDFHYSNDYPDNPDDILSINNTSVGYSLFTFLARNTTVEWSYIIGTKSYITTSHGGFDNGSTQIVRDELRQFGVGSVSLFLHDHPLVSPTRFDGLYGPSGYYERDRNSGDRNFATWIDQNFPGNNIVFSVYDVTTSQLFFYGHGTLPDLSYFNFTGIVPAYRQYQPIIPGQ